ncbi:phosphonate ABC transporter ATP-binding protein [Paenibacillus sp.]|uniref:phosphonate ABC transporter ATP-binding protein n=1 Tax=Paenibacillus sp. TaxID=58172 RepID=UPI002D6DB68F|nr:ATP-binding cassette domain-containing protein [Paenibacillus sp.]HZG86603.1 ATP-binding cassette domain-containing protein [Paenibacillus sp.]
MLKANGLTKSYGDTQVLRGIDLEVHRGDFVAVIGGSGSGKSTLLRCLVGKERPDGGEVVFNGVNLTKSSWWARWEASKDWAVIGTADQLNGRRTAFRNVVTGRLRQFSFWRLLLGGKPSEEEHIRAMDHLEQVGLLDKAFQPVEKLSGGEKQRVLIARALSQGAKLIVADDPVSSLDPHSAERMMESFKELYRRETVTVVCALQNIEMAEKYASRIVGIVDGRVEFDIRARRLTAAERNKLLSR